MCSTATDFLLTARSQPLSWHLGKNSHLTPVSILPSAYTSRRLFYCRTMNRCSPTCQCLSLTGSDRCQRLSDLDDFRWRVCLGFLGQSRQVRTAKCQLQDECIVSCGFFNVCLLFTYKSGKKLFYEKWKTLTVTGFSQGSLTRKCRYCRDL